MKKYILIIMLGIMPSLHAQSIAAPPGTTITQKNTQVEKIDGFDNLEKDTGLKLYMEVGTETLIAMRDNKIKWRADVMGSCGKPEVGKPMLRIFQLVEGKIVVTYGKHCSAAIDPESGKVECRGCD